MTATPEMRRKGRDADDIDELDAAQGGGPPPGMPWTLLVPDESWEADLEHAAPLPRVGDRIEYIATDGARRVYRVTEIVHTVQASASERPRVGAEQTGPNSIVDGPPQPPGELRAGLPRVVVVPED